MTRAWSEPFNYDFAPWRDRPKIVWPGGAQLAFWVAPNIEFYELAPPPSPTRAVWYRPEPDVMNYSWRDYGNRVGFHRVADVMRNYGAPGSVSLNVALCDHFPDIIERGCELGWEFFSHGIYNTRYLFDLTEDQQREVIRDSQRTIRKYTGQNMDGWLSPAISNLETTQDILAEEGVKYTLDLYHDDQPMPVKVRKGRMTSLPYMMEVNDSPVLGFKHNSPANYLSIIKAHFDQLYEEGAESGTVMCLNLHPYLMGQPHRIGVLDEALRYITRHNKVWVATAREIVAWYDAHYYDAFADWIGKTNAASGKELGT